MLAAHGAFQRDEMLLHGRCPPALGAAGRSRAASSRRCSHIVCATSKGSSRKTMTLPIFPLNVVALPAATVPLMIFEARYRVLFSTLLWEDGAKDLEEGLVQKDSPFCGSKRFGMCYVDNEGRLAAVGTVLQVQDYALVQSDGRLFVNNKGKERFQIKSVVKEKPVLLCEVELLPEDEDDTPQVRELAREVADLLRSTIRLNVRMNNISASEDQMEPEELAELGPRDLSYFVASFFSDVKLLQQNLLEEDSTQARLTKEKEILSETMRYYSAAAALKSAFSMTTTADEPSVSSTVSKKDSGTEGSSSSGSSGSSGQTGSEGNAGESSK